MEPWLRDVLERIKELADAGLVEFTNKAQAEIDRLGWGLDVGDARDVVSELEAHEFTERIRSILTDEWLYVFKPVVFDHVIYLKLALRDGCVVISFHRDSDGEEDDE